MNDRSESWKVAIVGLIGAAIDGPAYGLLYSFPSRAEAEEHAACFRKTGVKYAFSDERGNLSRLGSTPGAPGPC
jgi:hypothetical protein